MHFHSVIAGLAALGLASAAPATSSLSRRGLQASACSNPQSGLSSSACKILASVGFLQQGINSNTNNGIMWIGNDGPSTFQFTNGGDEDVTVVGWNMPPGTYTGMDVNVSPAQITYTLAKGKAVTISIAGTTSGAFAGLYSDTKLVNGQVSETWIEFTSGNNATVDVSREVKGDGRSIAAVVKGNGCKTNMDTCVFKCTNGQNVCGDKNTYALDNCANGSQEGATYGVYDGQPSGGCQGWTDNGHVDIVLNGNGDSVPSGGNSGSSGSSGSGSSGSQSSAAAPAPSSVKYNPPATSVAPPPAPTTHAAPASTPTQYGGHNFGGHEFAAVQATPTPTPTPSPHAASNALAVVADGSGNGPLRELNEN